MPQPRLFREFQDSEVASKLILELADSWKAAGVDLNNLAEKCFLFALAAHALHRAYTPKNLPSIRFPGDLTQWLSFWASKGVMLPLFTAVLPDILKIPLSPRVETIYSKTFSRTDFFGDLYQQLLPHSTRFRQGEFYTPQILANKIVAALHLLEDRGSPIRVIDPACGTGAFLIACYLAVLDSDLPTSEQVAWLNQVVGYDINPFAVELGRINLLLLVANTSFWKDPSFINIQVRDTLQDFISGGDSGTDTFDIVIGNPPWGSLARISAPSLREQMVASAKRLDILAPIQANNELATIFMDICASHLLQPRGRVAMILPRTVLESSSLDKWRVLREYDKVYCWVVDESIFPIPGVVFFARKCLPSSSNTDSIAKYRIPVSKVTWNSKKTSTRSDIDDLNDSKPAEVTEEKQVRVTSVQHWVPYHIDWDKDNATIRRVRKWVPEDALRVPVEQSIYYNRAEKGANIGPITFISVIPCDSLNSDLLKIVPDSEGGKVPFSTPPYTCATIERGYIFPYVKSKDLIPFAITRTRYCFLPMVAVGDRLVRDMHLRPHAAVHWTLLTEQYAALRPVPAGKDLFSHYLNHKGHLESPKMGTRYKVVFNEGGQRVKAAILYEGEIVEHTLVFVPVESQEEGYYLAGILNSEHISHLFAGQAGRGSARHVSLRPLEVPIPPYTPADPSIGGIQEVIVAIAQSIEKRVWELIRDSPPSIPPSTIEKRAHAYFPALWTRLNVTVAQLFFSGSRNVS